MNDEPEFELITPNGTTLGNAIDRPWIMVMSAWLDKHEELVEWIEGAFRQPGPCKALPTIYLIDDLDGEHAEHRKFLMDLTEKGATILAPETDAESISIKTDPCSFVARQISVGMHACPVLTSKPSEPDGYKEFGTAFTRLSTEDLETLIKGAHPK